MQTTQSDSVGAATCCAASNASWFANRKLLLAAGLVLALGAAAAAGGWGWLVAIGIAPVLLSVLPCLVMCGLGLCMNHRARGGSGTVNAAPTPVGTASLPALGQDEGRPA